MSILDFFIKLFYKVNDGKMPTDLRKAECPSCHNSLNKIPSAKTKCPRCLKYMFVRTTPKTNTRIVVTEDNADRIDEEWEIINGTTNSHDSKHEYLKVKNEVVKKGRVPRQNDIKWGLCNKYLGIHYVNRDWGLYRCVRFDMAVILSKESRNREALKTFLEVAYIDLNGPNNMRGMKDDFIKQFEPEMGDIADGLLGYIIYLIKKEKCSIDTVKELFMNQAHMIQKSINSPLSPEECWKMLKVKIEQP